MGCAMNWDDSRTFLLKLSNKSRLLSNHCRCTVCSYSSYFFHRNFLFIQIFSKLLIKAAWVFSNSMTSWNKATSSRSVMHNKQLTKFLYKKYLSFHLGKTKFIQNFKQFHQSRYKLKFPMLPWVLASQNCCCMLY